MRTSIKETPTGNTEVTHLKYSFFIIKFGRLNFIFISVHYDNVTILGPVPAPLSYLRGNYRYRFLIKANIDVNIQKTLNEWLAQMPQGRGVRVQVDIDPYSFY